MKNKKLTVSIGIPAYNEKANIGHLLRTIVVQRQSNFRLKEIIVISDGSIDGTFSEVKKIKDKRIKLVIDKSRAGQAARQNEIINLFQGDILVILEADTLPCNSNTINNLVAPFVKNNTQKLGMVVGQPVYLPAKTLIEKIESHAEKITPKLFSEWRNGDNLFSAGGHAMKALSRDFAAKLIWPSDVPEDSYTYLRLKQLGLKMAIQPNTKAYVKKAANLKESIRKNKKFVGGIESLKKYFSPDLINKEFTPPFKLIIKHLFLAMLKSPLLTTLYLLRFLLFQILNFKVKKINPLDEPCKSTKNLLPVGEVQ